jgi:cobalt-zinc-cadmium efflux system outer membrane protein
MTTMKTRMVGGVAVLVAVLLTPSVAAAQAMSIDALVELALERAPTLAASRARVGIFEGEKRQAGLRPNPVASMERRELFGGLDTETAVGVRVPLDLFRRDARVAVADADVRIAALRADDDARMLISEVRTRAVDLLAAERTWEIAASLAKTARSRLDLLTARVASGASRPLDRDLADVEARRADAVVISARSDADRALMALKALVGLPQSASLQLSDTLETVATEAMNRADSADAVHRPDLQERETEIARAAAVYARASREGRFDLSVFGEFMTRRVAESSGSARMNEVMLGVMVDLPWRNRQQGAKAAAEASERVARARLADGLLAVEAEVAGATVAVASTRQVVRLYRGGLIEVAARNLEVVRDAWSLGQGTLFDVIDEERRYIALQSEYTMALRNLADARTALDHARGRHQ